MSQETFLIIDGHALIYRAYHAFTGLTTHEGLLVNAVYGFSRILLTAMKDFNPKYIIVTFDHPSATFRHTQFAGYKEHRPEMPDDLKPQIELIKKVVTTLNIPQFEIPGYEADDLIGTYSNLIYQKHKNMITVIVTGDKDTFQLVNDRVHVWMPGRGKGQMDTEYDEAGVLVKMGVRPDQVVDLKALMGDASDNIPGVPGVGSKTASRLIGKFGSLDGLYQSLKNADSLSELQKKLLTPRLVKLLTENYEMAIMSQQLARIDCAVPVSLKLEDCRLAAYEKAKVIELFNEFDFKSLLRLLPPDEFELDVQQALF